MTLRTAAFAGVRWTSVSVFLRGLLQLAQTMVLARLLTPEDFGLMAIMFSMYAIIGLFVDLGISNALVHFPSLSPTARSTLYWTNLAAAILAMLVFTVLAWPAAAFYGKPELLMPMTVLAMALPIGALGQQFCLLAEKELRFSGPAVIELAAACFGFVAAVLVALLEGGVYALVAASVVTAAASSALAWLFLSEGVRPTLVFALGAIKPHLRYGSYRLGENILNAVHSQADVLIGGAVVGAGVMGFYTLPRNLSQQLANSVVNPVVTRIGLPVMAKLQGDRAALGTVYLQTLRMTASVNFPLYAVLAVWAHEVVDLLLGDQWRQAGDLLRILAVWGLIRSTGNPVGSLLYATGRVRVAFWWNVALFALVPGVLAFGVVVDGTRGLCFGMLAVQILIFYPMFRILVQPACGISFRQYVITLAVPLAGSVLAASLGLAAASWMFAPAWASVAAGVVIAAAVYLAFSRMANPVWWAAMSELLQPLWRRT